MARSRTRAAVLLQPPRRRAVPAPSPWIRRGRSGIHGRGIFARCAIAAGTRVIEYVGERITKAEAYRREQARLARQRRGGDGCVYVFELNRRHDIDGDVPYNLARLINHSCRPNCTSDIVRGRIWIIAERDIAAGEEITYDYGYDFKDWRLHPCRCGVPDCAGYIVKRAQRWRVRRVVRAAAAKSGAASRAA